MTSEGNRDRKPLVGSNPTGQVRSSTKNLRPSMCRTHQKIEFKERVQNILKGKEKKENNSAKNE